MHWEQVNLWVAENMSELIMVMGAALLLLLAAVVFLLIISVTLKKRYQNLMLGCDGNSMEDLLNHYGVAIQEAQDKLKKVDLRLKKNERQTQASLAGVGLVRFNAFKETGGELSFSLALLDRKFNGVVLTNIFGREESRCYGKPVEGGQSSYLLSEEELRALKEAKKNIGR